MLAGSPEEDKGTPRLLKSRAVRKILAFLLPLVLWAATAQAGEVLILKATAYTSSPRETDRTPYVTATGAKTRLGVLAVSRDLLEKELPYGSLVRLYDLGRWQDGKGAGAFDPLFKGLLFVVEDTMNKRKRQQIDVWLPDRSLALKFGVRRIKVVVVRRGRGP